MCFRALVAIGLLSVLSIAACASGPSNSDAAVGDGSAGAGADGRIGDGATKDGGACALPTGGLYAKIAVAGETYDVSITNAQGIQEALDGWQGRAAANIPVGKIVCTHEAWNCGYRWHIDPELVTFAEISPEVCDGLPSYVEANCNYGGGTFCPWAARLVALRDCRTDASCPLVPRP